MTREERAGVVRAFMEQEDMNTIVKMHVSISRKSAMLLNYVIERGSTIKEDDKESGLLASAGKEVLEELKGLSAEFLEKAKLVSTSAYLKSLN